MNVAFIAEKLGGEYEKIGGARQSLMENMAIPKSELRKELGDQLCITANNSERCFVSFLSLSLLSFHKTARRAPSNSIGWKRLKYSSTRSTSTGDFRKNTSLNALLLELLNHSSARARTDAPRSRSLRLKETELCFPEWIH
jgi:hypothetical protein